MTHAYCQLYLSKASRTVGFMLHDAVIEFGIDGADFLNLFIQSGIAEQIENGNPKYIAGRSGLELFLDVMSETVGEIQTDIEIKNYERSDVFWVGWVLTHYQWYSCRTFKCILETISFNDFMCLYDTLHEADIRKCYDVLDSFFLQEK